MEELKPCKCGKSDVKDEDVHWDIDGHHWRIYCASCGATTYFHSAYHFCEEDWNNDSLAYDGT